MDPHFMPEWKAGDKIGSFRVESFAGHGSYGEVLLVRDIQNELLALKILNHASQREWEGVLQSRKMPVSPAFVTIHYMDRLPDGRYYYVMDAADNLSEDASVYVPDTLEARLQRQGPMTAAQIFPILTKLLQGLKFLHEAGLAHRDIKPANIIFRHGEPLFSDCGLVRKTDAAFTLTGTPGFLPPEALTVKPDPVRWDLYAMGKVLYCMWTGLDSAEYPAIPQGRPMQEYKIVRRIYAKACSEKIQDRFRNAGEFLLAIENKDIRTVRSKRILFCICAAVLSACAASILITMYPKRTAEVSAPAPAVRKNPAPLVKTYEELVQESFFLSEEDRELYDHIVNHSNDIQEVFQYSHVFQLEQDMNNPDTSPEERKKLAEEIRKSKEYLKAFDKTPAGILSLTAGQLAGAAARKDAVEYLKIRERARKALEDYKKVPHKDWPDCKACERNKHMEINL